MHHIELTPTAEGWLGAAERLLTQRIRPEEILWRERGADQQSLPGLWASEERIPEPSASAPTVPAAFASIVREVACHSMPERWRLLYAVWYRLRFEQPALLEVLSDPQVRALHRLQAQVRKAVYRMKALVRFRRTGEGTDEWYVAWHRPEHDVLPLAAPFFVERFGAMRWSIFTPTRAVHWDGSSLQYGPGAPARDAPSDDELDELWRLYYATTFNPARENYVAMRTQLPVRHWATLPESRLIGPLRHAASERIGALAETRHGMAVVPEASSLETLASAARECAGCDLHFAATQTVFGRGPQTARMMLVGEQPGDEEDRAGAPFVGPAGQVLEQAIAEAGLDRSSLYVTNAVKHFKFVLQGRARRHQRPSAAEVVACRPWLEAELRLVQPRLIVALGGTAAHALLGRAISVLRQHGQTFQISHGLTVLVTIHPSAVLRARDESSARALYATLVGDMSRAKILVEPAPG